MRKKLGSEHTRGNATRPVRCKGNPDQIRRASKSIPANIAEGFGKQRSSFVEFRRYLFIAMGAADEMRVWCRYCFDLGYIDEAAWRHWRDSYKEIAKMLQGLINSLGIASDP